MSIKIKLFLHTVNITDNNATQGEMKYSLPPDMGITQIRIYNIRKSKKKILKVFIQLIIEWGEVEVVFF